jgi:hypothetical protein
MYTPMRSFFMSLLLVCPCGKRWTSDASVGSPAAVCPVCGRPLKPDVGGWRVLWPRLTLAAGATLLVVIVATVALARLLPTPSHQTPAITVEVEQREPSPSPVASSLPPLDPPAALTEKPILPLLDNLPTLAPPLEEPSRPRPAETTTPKSAEPPLKSVREMQEKDEFFQHLVISRVSRYRILDLDMGQNVQYVLVSRFRVEKKNEDGGMVVEQKVEGVRLSNADPAMHAKLNDLLQKTKGATFTLTLNARREVTKFEGGPEALKVFAGANPLGGPSFLLWSFLDRDGWKEMAQLSFFQPPPSPRRGERWQRPMTHSWGPLGNWDGKIHFQANGKQTGRERFDYQLELAYKPPRSAAGLPFEIGKSRFQIQTARGVIAYQADRGQVAAAEERFHVRGVLAVSFLGAESAVQMDEMQIFQLRIVDKNPLEP